MSNDTDSTTTSTDPSDGNEPAAVLKPVLPFIRASASRVRDLTEGFELFALGRGSEVVQCVL